jgi:hypothetical protein
MSSQITDAFLRICMHRSFTFTLGTTASPAAGLHSIQSSYMVLFLDPVVYVELIVWTKLHRSFTFTLGSPPSPAVGGMSITYVKCL